MHVTPLHATWLLSTLGLGRWGHSDKQWLLAACLPPSWSMHACLSSAIHQVCYCLCFTIAVKDLLEVNPNAKAIQLPRAPSAAPSSEGPADGGAGSGDAVGDVASGAGGEAAPQRRKPAKRKAVAAAAEAELVPDEELPPREGEMPVRGVSNGSHACVMLPQGAVQCSHQLLLRTLLARPAAKCGPLKELARQGLEAMPTWFAPEPPIPQLTSPSHTPVQDPQPLAARKAAGGGAVASKRPRGGLAWLADVPDEVALPGGRAGAELAVVLEFLQVRAVRLVGRCSIVDGNVQRRDTCAVHGDTLHHSAAPRGISFAVGCSVTAAASVGCPVCPASMSVLSFSTTIASSRNHCPRLLAGFWRAAAAARPLAGRSGCRAAAACGARRRRPQTPPLPLTRRIAGGGGALQAAGCGEQIGLPGISLVVGVCLFV